MTATGSRSFARGELTLIAGDPTVRINRQHSTTLNLKLRVRVGPLEIAGKCHAEAMGAHVGSPQGRLIRLANEKPDSRVAAAGTR